MPREAPDKGVEAVPGSAGKEPADHGTDGNLLRPTAKGEWEWTSGCR